MMPLDSKNINISIARTFDPAQDEENALILEKAGRQLAKAKLMDYHPKVYESLSRDELSSIADTSSLPSDDAVRGAVKKILCNHMVDEISKKAGMGEEDPIMQAYIKEKKDIITQWEPSLTGPSLTKLGKELDTTLAGLQGTLAEPQGPLVSKVSDSLASVKKVEAAQRMDELDPLTKVQIARVNAAADIIKKQPVSERHSITAEGLTYTSPQTVGHHLGRDTHSVTMDCGKLLRTDRPMHLQATDSARETFQGMRKTVSALYDKFLSGSDKDAPKAPSSDKKTTPVEPPTFRK